MIDTLKRPWGWFAPCAAVAVAVIYGNGAPVHSTRGVVFMSATLLAGVIVALLSFRMTFSTLGQLGIWKRIGWGFFGLVCLIFTAIWCLMMLADV